MWSTQIDRIVTIYILCLTLGSGLKRFCQFRTCVKCSVVWGHGPVVRRCSPQSLPVPAPRRPPTHTSDRHSVHVHHQCCLPKMTLLYTRTLPLLPDEGPERRRPPPTSDVYKETCRAAEPSRAHPVRGTSESCPHHTPNQHMPEVAVKPPLQRLPI